MGQSGTIDPLVPPTMLDSAPVAPALGSTLHVVQIPNWLKRESCVVHIPSPASEAGLVACGSTQRQGQQQGPDDGAPSVKSSLQAIFLTPLSYIP